MEGKRSCKGGFTADIPVTEVLFTAGVVLLAILKLIIL